MNRFMTELKMSGYSHHDRYEILKSGYSHYSKLRLKEASGVRPFYRKSNFQKLKRKQEKCVKKMNWYKNGNGNKFSSVFFVPSTPGSQLLKMLRKTEENNMIDPCSRIKFIETSGRKFIDQLKVRDPFQSNCKTEENCFICSNSPGAKPTNCKVANVGYALICSTCRDRKIEKVYIGETFRNGHLWRIEHTKL